MELGSEQLGGPEGARSEERESEQVDGLEGLKTGEFVGERRDGSEGVKAGERVSEQVDGLEGGYVEIERLGEQAVLVRFGRRIAPELHHQVLALDALLQANPFPGFVETVPAYAALAIHYDAWTVYRRSSALPFEVVSEHVRKLMRSASGLGMQAVGRTLEIPVCYGGDYGPDLQDVASHCGMPPEEVIRLHTDGEYQVFLIGFLPGFPYMGGLEPRLAAPRRATPRLAVPAGSVGIAGAQTGVYPLESPGGWQLIGRTPLRLFRPEADPVSLLQAGDRVRFSSISEAEYRALAREEAAAAP